MPKGDRAALGIDLVERDAQLVDAPQTLTGEGFVDLEDVDVVLADAGLLERDRDGFPGPDAHKEWRDANDRGRDEFAEDGLAELLGCGALHEQDGGGAIGDLRRVARVDGAVLCKGGADLAEGLGGDARARAVIFGHGDGIFFLGLGVGVFYCYGSDLGVEEAGFLSLDCFLVGACSKGVLVVARDVAVLGHLFGEDAHGDFAVGGLHVVFEDFGELGHGGWTILSRHAFDACTDADVNHARLDSIRDIDAGLEAARALSVESLDGG